MTLDNPPVDDKAVGIPRDHQLDYQPRDDEPLTEAIITAVSDALGVDHTELDPLFSVVDPDALEVVFRSNPHHGDCQVTFTYSGCIVAIDSDTVISIHVPESD